MATTDITTKSWLTVEDILTDLDITRSTFMKWRARGEGPRAKKLPSGGLRFRRDDYTTWLDALEEDAA